MSDSTFDTQSFADDLRRASESAHALACDLARLENAFLAGRIEELSKKNPERAAQIIREHLRS